MAQPVYLVTPLAPVYAVEPWPSAQPTPPAALAEQPVCLATHELATGELGT
jgi:hypothetical protein